MKITGPNGEVIEVPLEAGVDYIEVPGRWSGQAHQVLTQSGLEKLASVTLHPDLLNLAAIRRMRHPTAQSLRQRILPGLTRERALVMREQHRGGEA